jgi:hypothetical protein
MVKPCNAPVGTVGMERRIEAMTQFENVKIAPWFKKQEPSNWPVLKPQILGDSIALVYPGGTINAVYTLDEAKAEFKYLSNPKRRFKTGLSERRSALEQGIKILTG